MKTPYLTNPEGVFNKDLLETIDINELQNLVIQTRHRLEERISSQSPATSMFVQITHLADEAEAANDLSIKSHKFQEATNLAFKLAQQYQENNLNTVFELLKNYSYLLQINKNFSLALYYLNLAKEAKTNNNKATQYKNYTEAFKLLTEVVTNYWRLCPTYVRWMLDISANKLLVDQELGQKKVLSKMKFWFQMLLPSIKSCKNLVANYKKAKREYIRSVLMKVETYPDLYLPSAENMNSIKEHGLTLDDVLSVHKYAYRDTKFPQLQAVLYEAIEETIQMMKMGVDISDPLVITPVGWIAQKYPEISGYCNQILTELVEKQFSNPLLEIEDQTMTGEF
ncbi:hypothetical protein [Nostoc sp. 'Peltigera malacea cyanobiont' DB3992]|uniref:hypothetical protein n=1 Tax=Nostoc sp. 'Peltigera malacea cyanobiont' DB3992 TaxID=1206980 RepID=UPI000C03F0DC|nr:hypothetical protein [Nostoc sp. 'Peltigera malacea cyanobiont' DB3992]PHM11091.1 hypothetical protein CK516_04795 [Nostoc sp. 'Peltigera malacea cyanobiont' DB3992]